MRSNEAFALSTHGRGDTAELIMMLAFTEMSHPHFCSFTMCTDCAPDNSALHKSLGFMISNTS